MERTNYQMSLLGMIGVVACVALNIWLFRIGPLLGILALNVTKHVLIAYVCQVAGVNRRVRTAPVVVADLPASSSPTAV
jgi:hypothetical protein